MAIIINEFEIVAPPDGAASDGGDRPPSRNGATPTASAAAAVQPIDVEEIMRRALQRRLRVWAD